MGRLCAGDGMENSAPLFNNQRCPKVAFPKLPLCAFWKSLAAAYKTTNN
jgi:hypothetical protein